VTQSLRREYSWGAASCAQLTRQQRLRTPDMYHRLFIECCAQPELIAQAH
jgi:hypothetical protein